MANKNNKNLPKILHEKENIIQKLESLIQTSQIITSSLKRKKVIKSVIKLACDMLQSETASVLLIDEVTNELVFDFSTDLNANQQQKIRVPIGKGISGFVAQTGQSVNIKDVSKDSRWYADVDQKSGFETHSLLCVPLKFQDKIIGTAQVLNKVDESVFTQFDQKLLEAFAAQAAIAIQNARLFEELQTAYNLLNEENIHLRKEITKIFKFENIIGKSKKMQLIFQLIEQIKDLPTTILIQGDTGTGKELIAKTIHYSSLRKNKKFVAINCGAFPEQLLASELFGHKRGSFTGAISDKKGLFEEANGGTIFLDEIGDVSPQLQVELLRVLQENEIRRIGENQPRKIDVRIISATHQNLKKQIENGKFRQDLYYRLKVITIELPTLRERKEDIPLLIMHFIKKYSKLLNKKTITISLEAMKLLQEYEWQGNIRELEHEIERTIALMENVPEITTEHLSPEIRFFYRTKNFDIETEGKPLKEMVAAFERKVILEELNRCQKNISETAKNLGITRQGLWKKLKNMDAEV